MLVPKGMYEFVTFSAYSSKENRDFIIDMANMHGGIIDISINSFYDRYRVWLPQNSNGKTLFGLLHKSRGIDKIGFAKVTRW